MVLLLVIVEKCSYQRDGFRNAAIATVLGKVAKIMRRDSSALPPRTRGLLGTITKLGEVAACNCYRFLPARQDNCFQLYKALKVLTEWWCIYVSIFPYEKLKIHFFRYLRCCGSYLPIRCANQTTSIAQRIVA